MARASCRANRIEVRRHHKSPAETTPFGHPIKPHNQINKGKLFGHPKRISYHCRNFDTGYFGRSPLCVSQNRLPTPRP